MRTSGVSSLRPCCLLAGGLEDLSSLPAGLEVVGSEGPARGEAVDVDADVEAIASAICDCDRL